MERMEQSECMERPEMAHIKMEAAVEASNRWRISDAPLLRWRKSLKRAAQECDDTLRSCKQRTLEDEARAHRLRRSYFPTRIAQATKSFISSLILAPGTGNNGLQQTQPSSSTVRRFDRYADGAEQFLRFVHLGCTPLRPYAFSNPLVGQLMAGEFLRYEMLSGGQYRHFAVQTVYSAERGVEAQVSLVYADIKKPMNNFYLWMILRLSESVDIIGTGVKSLLSAAFSYERPRTIDAVAKELTQLPTQDFHWSPAATFFDQKKSENLHRVFVQRFRPDPFCCKGHGSAGMPCVPEPVVEFFLQRYVLTLPDEHNGHMGNGFPTLRLTTYMMPHDSPIDLDPAYECCAIDGMDGDEHGGVHVNFGLDKLEQVLLPKAVEYLCCRAEATTYQVSWKSRHGTAQICLEKTGATQQVTSELEFQPYDYVLKTLMQGIHHGLKMWVIRSSAGLRDTILSWTGLRDAILSWIQEVNPLP